MRCFALATILAALPLAAAAQSQLDRLEAVSERGNDIMIAAMVADMAAMGMDTSSLPEMPPMEWNDRMRTAGACMVEAYTAEIGSDGLDRMLDDMEAMFDQMDGLSMEQISELGDEALPEGLSADRSIEISQDCGMIEAQMEWMDSTGLMDAMFGSAIDG